MILSRRSRSFLRSKYASTLVANITGNRLDMTCEIALRFSPQPRQNFVSPLSCIPHLGQYIKIVQTRAIYRNYAAALSIVPMDSTSAQRSDCGSVEAHNGGEVDAAAVSYKSIQVWRMTYDLIPLASWTAVAFIHPSAFILHPCSSHYSNEPR